MSKVIYNDGTTSEDIVIDDVVITEKHHIFYYTKKIVGVEWFQNAENMWDDENAIRLKILKFLDKNFGEPQWAVRLFGYDKEHRYVFCIWKKTDSDTSRDVDIDGQENQKMLGFSY